jgi:hypothetical protein
MSARLLSPSSNESTPDGLGASIYLKGCLLRESQQNHNSERSPTNLRLGMAGHVKGRVSSSLCRLRHTFDDLVTSKFFRAAEELPHGWEIGFDSSSCSYYIDRNSGTTRWERPDVALPSDSCQMPERSRPVTDTSTSIRHEGIGHHSSPEAQSPQLVVAVVQFFFVGIFIVVWLFCVGDSKTTPESIQIQVGLC